MPLIITAVHCTEYEFSNSYLRCSQASRWDGIDMVCHTVPFVEELNLRIRVKNIPFHEPLIIKRAYFTVGRIPQIAVTHHFIIIVTIGYI